MVDKNIGDSAEDFFDFEKMERFHEKYRYETRLVFTGKKDTEQVEGFLCLGTVAINNITNRICYVESQKEDWFRRVTPVEITRFMIEEAYHPDLIKASVNHFKEYMKQKLALLEAEPFDVNQLREGGTHYEDYVEYVSDSQIEKDPSFHIQLDNTPYY